MSFLLDTNVVSEWTKPRPNAGVVEWLARVEEDEVFLSVVTIAELRHGIERLPAGERRRRRLMLACRRRWRLRNKKRFDLNAVNRDLRYAHI